MAGRCAGGHGAKPWAGEPVDKVGRRSLQSDRQRLVPRAHPGEVTRLTGRIRLGADDVAHQLAHVGVEPRVKGALDCPLEGLRGHRLVRGRREPEPGTDPERVRAAVLGDRGLALGDFGLEPRALRKGPVRIVVEECARGAQALEVVGAGERRISRPGILGDQHPSNICLRFDRRRLGRRRPRLDADPDQVVRKRNPLRRLADLHRRVDPAVSGSIRESVPLRLFATHTPPPPTAIPVGRPPTGIVSVTVAVRGSTRATDHPACSLPTPLRSPTATAAGACPTGAVSVIALALFGSIRVTCYRRRP